ncbi:MAG: hypothetical protein QOJ60_2123 [Actinomycetota bacterium]|nr:hypothetical protein [Actinomycetota bacterium]
MNTAGTMRALDEKRGAVRVQCLPPQSRKHLGAERVDARHGRTDR